METGYIDCLKKELPCDCIHWGLPPIGIHYSLNPIDSSFFENRYRILNYQNQNNESISFDIRSIMGELIKENE